MANIQNNWFANHAFINGASSSLSNDIIEMSSGVNNIVLHNGPEVANTSTDQRVGTTFETGVLHDLGSPSPRGIDEWGIGSFLDLGSEDMRMSNMIDAKELTSSLEGNKGSDSDATKSFTTLMSGDMSVLTRPGSGDTRENNAFECSNLIQTNVENAQTRFQTSLTHQQSSMYPSAYSFPNDNHTPLQINNRFDQNNYHQTQAHGHQLQPAMQLNQNIQSTTPGELAIIPNGTSNILDTSDTQSVSTATTNGSRTTEIRATKRMQHKVASKQNKKGGRRGMNKRKVSGKGNIATANGHGRRGRASANQPHLTEEEVKRMRRVKNRESVEKCRTKQRMRTEALQVEQTCLMNENKAMNDVFTRIEYFLNQIHENSNQIEMTEAMKVKLSTFAVEAMLPRD